MNGCVSLQDTLDLDFDHHRRDCAFRHKIQALSLRLKPVSTRSRRGMSGNVGTNRDAALLVHDGRILSVVIRFRW